MLRILINAWSVAVVLCLGLAASGAAGPLEDGIAAYGRGDFATAQQLLRPLADQGDATAQASFGLMYQNGHGVPQDQAEAAKWFRRAAEQGLAIAQNFLADAMYAGDGVPQDHAQVGVKSISDDSAGGHLV